MKCLTSGTIPFGEKCCIFLKFASYMTCFVSRAIRHSNVDDEEKKVVKNLACIIEVPEAHLYNTLTKTLPEDYEYDISVKSWKEWNACEKKELKLPKDKPFVGYTLSRWRLNDLQTGTFWQRLFINKKGRYSFPKNVYPVEKQVHFSTSSAPWIHINP